MYKHSSLFGPFVSYKELSVMNMTPRVISTTLPFLHNLRDWPYKLECYITLWLPETNTLAYCVHKYGRKLSFVNSAAGSCQFLD
jgi:hypothetical protein